METKEISGKIEKVISSSGNTRGKRWERWEFTIDGNKYSTFDKEIGNSFKEGDLVQVDLEQNGKFWNMNSMILLSKSGAEKVSQEDKAEKPSESPQTSDLLNLILNELQDLNIKVDTIMAKNGYNK